MSNACFGEHFDTIVFKNWLKSSSAFISIKNLDGKYLGISEIYAKFLGYESSEDIVGKYTPDVFSLRNAASYAKQDKLVVNAVRQFTFKNKYVHPEKGLLYLEIVKTPILNEKMSVVAIETVVTDVTEKYLLFNKWQREQLKFRKFFNDIPVAVWIKDARNRYVNVNREFCAFCNSSKDEVIGQKYVNQERVEGIIGEEELSLIRAQDEFVLKENKKHILEFCTIRDGKKCCIKMIKIPISIKGKVIGLIGCCHSTSDKKPM